MLGVHEDGIPHFVKLDVCIASLAIANKPAEVRIFIIRCLLLDEAVHGGENGSAMGDDDDELLFVVTGVDEEALDRLGCPPGEFGTVLSTWAPAGAPAVNPCAVLDIVLHRFGAAAFKGAEVHLVQGLDGGLQSCRKTDPRRFACAQHGADVNVVDVCDASARARIGAAVLA